MLRISLYILGLALLLVSKSEGCKIKDINGTELCCPGFSEENGKCLSNCKGQFDKSSRIVVIGAGPSGIAAATRLLSHGFTNVTVLEGQNRIGGRVNTVPFGDAYIDLGAQWCHGEKNNVVYEMVKDKNLLEKSKPGLDGFVLVRSDSEMIPKEVSSKLFQIIEDCLDDVDERVPLKSSNDSLGAYISECFFNAMKSEERYASIDADVAKEFLEFAHKGICTNEGAKTLYDVSWKGNSQYVTAEGDQNLNWKGKGYKTILNLLMESKCNDFGILNNRIFLNQEVSNIISDKTGVNSSKVKCSSGIELEADHVIFTGSVGVLRDRIKTLFVPELPENKYRATKGLGFGTVNKMFLHFSERWWTDDFRGLILQWKESDLEDLLKSEYAWVASLCEFATVSHQPNVLLAWFVGESALQLESLPIPKQLEGVMYVLKRFLNESNIPQPIDFISTAWNSNPFTRGSWSYRSMDTEALETGAADLAEPILAEDKKPVLMFAGEATNSHHYSTVHGAIESGWREADRIYEYYCKKA